MMEDRLWTLQEVEDERTFGLNGAKLVLEEPRRRCFNIPMPDPEESLKLLRACKDGDLGLVKQLIEEDMTCLKEQDEHKMSPVFIALIFGRKEVAHFLIKNYPDQTHRDRHRNCVIHYTIYLRSLELTRLLLEQGMDPVEVDIGFNPNRCMHLAVMSGSIAMVDLLLQQPSVNLKAGVQYGPNPLWSAALLDRIDMFKYLYAKDRTLGLAICAEGFNIFEHCVWSGATRVVQWLMEQGKGDPNVGPDPVWPNALHLVAHTGSYELLTWLIERYQDTMVVPSSEGLSPILVAACRGRLECLKLLEAIDNIHGKSSDGSNAMMYACASGQLAVAQYLQTKGLPLDEKNNDGSTPLHQAAARGKWPVLKWLLDNGVTVDVQDRFGCSPLHHACENGHLEAAKVLVEFGANPHIHALLDDPTRTVNGTPFLLACHGKHLEVMKYLYTLAPGEIEQAKTSHRNSAYYICACAGFLGGLEWLESINLPFDNQEGLGLVLIVTEFGFLGVLKWLVAHGVSLEAQRGYSSPAIAAVIGGKVETLQWLLEQGCELKQQRFLGLSLTEPISLAVRYSNLEMTKYLIETLSHSPKTINAEGMGLIHDAVQSGASLELLDYLLQAGAPISSKPQGTDAQDTLLVACELGNLPIIKWLHRNGAPFDSPFNLAQSVLNNASANGDTKLIKWFLRHGYNAVIWANLTATAHAAQQMPQIRELLAQLGLEPT